MNTVKTFVFLIVVSFLALLVIWCGPPAETEKDEDENAEETGDVTGGGEATEVEVAEDEETKEEAVETSKATTLPKEITNSTGMKFSLIPAGSFMMGAIPGDTDARHNEKPRHRVEITKAFYIGVYEVTQEQYETVMGVNPSEDPGPNRPVTGVSWDDTVEFCRKLSEMTGEKYRLPTEAEWEYAYRAGTETKFYWGDEMDGDYAWYEDNNGLETHEVGGKLPNAWGLYDMSGNVSEWCEDWYDVNYYDRSPLQDPKGPLLGNNHVLRGGCGDDFDWNLRSSTRYGSSLDDWNYDVGFRVVREVEEK